MPGGPDFLREDGRPELAITHPQEVGVLFKVVDLSWSSSIMDPWAGTGTIPRTLRTQGHVVYSNDIHRGYKTDTHEDALQPGFYLKPRREGKLGAIVCSPWFRVIDLAAALAVHYAEHVVCLHAPGHFITDAAEPRRSWLSKLKSEGQLVVVTGLPNASLGWKCMWVIVFASREVKERMLRPGG